MWRGLADHSSPKSRAGPGGLPFFHLFIQLIFSSCRYRPGTIPETGFRTWGTRDVSVLFIGVTREQRLFPASEPQTWTLSWAWEQLSPAFFPMCPKGERGRLVHARQAVTATWAAEQTFLNAPSSVGSIVLLVCGSLRGEGDRGVWLSCFVQGRPGEEASACHEAPVRRRVLWSGGALGTGFQENDRRIRPTDADWAPAVYSTEGHAEMSSDPPLTSAGLSLARQVSMEVKLSAVRQAHDRGQSLTA